MPVKPKIYLPYERLKPDDDCMHEECGVFGVYRADNFFDAAETVYYGLYALQHRGQESAGIAVSDGKNIKYKKNMGLVTEVFKDGIDELTKANIAMGHVRYSTTGESHVFNAQPLVITSKTGKIALAHNGNLINAFKLRRDLENDGAIFQTTIDTEIIASLIARNGQDGILKAIEKTMSMIKGSYALVIMTEDKLIGIRDPLGIRPLALGKLGNSFILASETCAFDAVDAEFVRDVRPGEIIVIDRDGLKTYRASALLESALCIFEFVYFARPDSDIDGINVHEARENAGRRLAIAYPVEADIVAGVPDSARPAATGYAEQSGIPYKKALARNRYVGRTFIQPQQMMRERSVKIKLNVLKKNVHGKRVILVDDSIVRGTTSKKIVEMIKLAGAREVHMMISSPPIKCPCFFGIDTPSHEQLIGAKNSVEEIRKLIGADTLHYLSIEDLLKTVEGAALNFCVGCFGCKYPMDVEKETGKGNKLILEKC
jgi:amidophosphoribosyltransferase